MLRRMSGRALAVLGVIVAVIGLTASPSFAVETEDPRAVPFDDNATTCVDVGFPNSTLLFTAGSADNSDDNVSGDVHSGEIPGFDTDENALLDVTVDPGFVINAIVVKSGNQYNVYGPEDAPFTNLRAPLVGTDNIPEISHWYICYSVAQIPTGNVTLDKVTTGGSAPAANVIFTFAVDCESGTETTPVDIAPFQDPILVADDVGQGGSCTITETRTNGATSTTFAVTGGTVSASTADSVTFTVDATAVSVVATNTFGDVLQQQQEQDPGDPEIPRTGSGVAFWAGIAGIAFLIGGLALYGSAFRRFLPTRG